MDDQNRAADASREAFHGWWEEGDMSSTHHVVHGTRGSIKALLDLLSDERAKSEAGYRLSTYAACIHWDGSKNTREWFDGLREHIEKVQALYLRTRGKP